MKHGISVSTQGKRPKRTHTHKQYIYICINNIYTFALPMCVARSIGQNLHVSIFKFLVAQPTWGSLECLLLITRFRRSPWWTSLWLLGWRSDWELGPVEECHPEHHFSGSWKKRGLEENLTIWGKELQRVTTIFLQTRAARCCLCRLSPSPSETHNDPSETMRVFLTPLDRYSG